MEPGRPWILFRVYLMQRWQREEDVKTDLLGTQTMKKPFAFLSSVRQKSVKKLQCVPNGTLFPYIVHHFYLQPYGPWEDGAIADRALVCSHHATSSLVPVWEMESLGIKPTPPHRYLVMYEMKVMYSWVTLDSTVCVFTRRGGGGACWSGDRQSLQPDVKGRRRRDYIY
jgi:hypothetical protein